jgi:hypothetical protein
VLRLRETRTFHLRADRIGGTREEREEPERQTESKQRFRHSNDNLLQVSRQRKISVNFGDDLRL